MDGVEAERVVVVVSGTGVHDLALRERLGDRLAIVSANNVEWVVLWWAAAAIGAVVVPLNAWWKADELEFGLRDSSAKLLFCDPKRWQAVRDRLQALPELEQFATTSSAALQP